MILALYLPESGGLSSSASGREVSHTSPTVAGIPDRGGAPAVPPGPQTR